MSTPPMAHHTIYIALRPPLLSAREANLWVEDDGDASPDAPSLREGLSSSPASSSSPQGKPTLVLSRVDGCGEEMRFELPQGASRFALHHLARHHVATSARRVASLPIDSFRALVFLRSRASQRPDGSTTR